MSIIEQATKRLDELRRAGVDVPWRADSVPSVAAASGHATVAGTPSGTVAPVRAPAVALAAVRTETNSPVEPPAAAPRVSRSLEIDLDALAALGYLTPASTNRALADEFRVLKMHMIKNMKAAAARGVPRPNLFLVSSAAPGEGKTFVAMNLAMSLAMELDHSVLLVDADVLRPMVMNRLGVGEPDGLLDLITRPELDVADVMMRTNVPKLSLIGAGRQTLRSTELLASAGMERLLNELAERYADRIVVFDAPPLLVATEARLLATRVGQVMLVVEANRTDSQSVARAFAAVESCPMVSSVLNRCPRMTSEARYGNYYGAI